MSQDIPGSESANIPTNVCLIPLIMKSWGPVARDIGLPSVFVYEGDDQKGFFRQLPPFTHVWELVYNANDGGHVFLRCDELDTMTSKSSITLEGLWAILCAAMVADRQSELSPTSRMTGGGPEIMPS